MSVFRKTSADQEWITEYLTDLWKSTDIYLPNGQYDAAALPAFYTQDKDVVMTYNFAQRADVVTLNIPYGYDQNLIDQLFKALKDEAREQEYKEIYATVTNDNLDLMAYLQRANFRFHKIYSGAIHNARDQQETIPNIGRNNIQMRDEIEFVLDL